MKNTKKSKLVEIVRLRKKLKELGEIRNDPAQVKKYVKEGLETKPKFFKSTYEKIITELPKKDSENYLIDMFEALYVNPIFSKLIKYQNQENGTK